MIVVAGRAEVHPEKIGEALELARRVAELTRLEAGCIEYGFHVPLESPSTLHVFERWESDEQLSAHLGAAHTREFLSAMGPLLAAPPAIRRHVVHHSGPLVL